jgi:two-component system, OmpR family, heavy metal sensor histidine kinase CusS
MRSIRRTLVLNVLLLLLVTLGTISAIAYRTTRQSLLDKERATAELVVVQFNDKRDEALLNQAHMLAREAQSQYDLSKMRQQLMASTAALLISPSMPSARFVLPVQIMIAGSGPPSWVLHSRLVTEIKLNEDDIYRETDSPEHEYIQIDTELGSRWLSKSLNGERLPFDMPALMDKSLYHAAYDDLTLPNGLAARRVIVKAPVTRVSRIGSFFGPRTDRPPPAPNPARAAVGVAWSYRQPRTPVTTGSIFLNEALPTMFVQCVWDTTAAHPHINELAEKRDSRLLELQAETKETLANLRRMLTWVAIFTIATTLIVGWILIGLGLSPLKRLSDAVSRISPKELRLSINPDSLPSEIGPVAERLSFALGELQAAFEREKRATADISHELRTPVAALRTTLDVACRKPRTAEEYRETLEDCRSIARQMGQLVERVMKLAWIDSGGDTMNNTDVAIPELVTDIATIAKPLANVQGLHLQVNVPKELSLRTDADKLREVVMNLTHNAIEYNRPGGEVELRAESLPSGGVAVEVRDTGIGMTPEVQGKIFERFFRADASRHQTGIHAGLGLAIVKEYVERLGGTLRVDSVLGTGSRFRIELPNAS